MSFFLKRILPALLAITAFGLIVYYITPPASWTDASVFQILIFFIPLLASLTLLLNIFLSVYSKSFSIALGLMVLLVLKSVDELNPVTAFLTILSSYLLSTTFKKPLWKPRKVESKLPPKHTSSLTSGMRIPKLTKFEKKRQRG